MNDIMKDISGIALALIGLATLAVLVSQRNQTANVIGASGNAFSKALSTAMGN
jgi:succinate dehydrogenase hydrophobic anchor subunit